MPINSLDEMHNDFMIYATEVNNNRAFPDARDGLKPGMRAALYTMWRKGFSANRPHVKSAKITGAVIGELWPHGDASVYESLVRMSQDWVNNIPEVDWHGANGSLLGGPEAASSRYTECRLAESSEDGFFSNIRKDTVNMIPNFSEDDTWPEVLPALFPRLFVNGSQGIGYTIAQEWEPGNLNEFIAKVKEYLKKKKITYNDIYPDYPTGGIIVNGSAMADLYKNGRGTIILRGKADIVGNIIQITSLPYQVYVEPFISNIKELVNSGKLTGIDDICNKSDDSGMLIEIECSDDPELVLSSLYKLTDLQCTFSANQMALVKGKPELLSLEEYIKVYIDHNLKCLSREYRHELNDANARLEIVDGLIKALNEIDTIISIIKKSKNSTDAKAQLVKKLKYTDLQAQAIVDMKLGKLAQLEGVTLAKEKSELDTQVAEFTKILGSDKLQEKEFIKRLDSFASKYGWNRRTEVMDIDIKKEKKEARKKKTSSEQFIITLSDNQEIKRISLSEYRQPQKDSHIINTIKVGAKDKFFLISNHGMLYKLQANNIPLGTMKSTGTKVNTLVELKQPMRDKDGVYPEYIKAIFSGTETEPYMFFITEKGNVKKMECSEVFSISKKSGTPLIKLKEEAVIGIYLVDDNSTIKIITSKPKEYVLKVSDFKVRGRKSTGVRGLKLKTYTLMYTSLLN